MVKAQIPKLTERIKELEKENGKLRVLNTCADNARIAELEKKNDSLCARARRLLAQNRMLMTSLSEDQRGDFVEMGQVLACTVSEKFVSDTAFYTDNESTKMVCRETRKDETTK